MSSVHSHIGESTTTVSEAEAGGVPGPAAAGQIRRPSVWRPITAIAVALTMVLLVANGGYGYHRDELYFRLLGRTPDWGYVDQPPLTPVLARLSAQVFGDTVWGLRVPAAVAAAGFVLLAALIAAELGGRRAAQILTAVGTGVSAFPVIAGHMLNTSTVDLLVWEAVILFACRAMLRGEGRWWLPVGVVTGLGLYNKHLVALLAIGLGIGLLAVGPRRVLLDRWLWVGAALALILGSPNIVYQIVNDWPQLKMATAIDRTDGTENRILFVPMQLLLLGPMVAPIWIGGLVAVFRRREWRPIRALAVAYPAIGVLVVMSGGQFYYPLGLLLFLFAVGCVAVERWWAQRSGRRAVVAAALAVNAATVAVIALPVIPVGSLHATPVPSINEVARESIGWPELAAQVSEVYAALPPEDRARAILFTGNYGEAGALDRYGPRYGLPKVYSGHNQLYFRARPPDTATVVVAVGMPAPFLHGLFGSCAVARRIDNGYDVDNEEQGAPITVCRQPREPWSQLWPRTLHYS